MTSATRAGLIALVEADRSIPPKQKMAFMSVINGHIPTPKSEAHAQEYYTTSEACTYLRCCRMTIFRMETDGQIESVRLRGKKLFEREELIKALKRGKEG